MSAKSPEYNKIPNKTISFLKEFVKPHFSLIILFIILGFGSAIYQTAFPYCIKIIIDSINNFTGEPTEIFYYLRWVLFGLVCLEIISSICIRSHHILMIYIFPELKANIRKATYYQLRKHSHDFFNNHFAGNLANKIADLPKASETVLVICLYYCLSNLLAFIIAATLMYIANPLYFFIIVIWVIAHMSLLISSGKYCNELAKEHSEHVSQLSGKIIDAIANITNIKLFARDPFESKYLNYYQENEIKKAKKSLWRIQTIGIINDISTLLFMLSIVFSLVYGWSKNWITVGDISLIAMLSFTIMTLISRMNINITTLYQELGTIKAALETINQQDHIIDKDNASKLIVTKGQIRFDNVSFHYKFNNNIFNKITLTIEPGTKVGLVGTSGSGKSTFINLILRLYDSSQGQILIDDQNIKNITQDSLRNSISMIPSDPSLFHRTLLENIRYGKLSATDEEVIAASRLAHCHEFITQLKDGYNELVGERGIKLSTGQRQRIAIARAILKNAPILILDEATSSLDSITEKLIHESLEILMKNKTTIIIAHRLSTLYNMDRILVFENGKIVEDGKASTLIKNDKYFANLWRNQIDGFLPNIDY